MTLTEAIKRRILELCNENELSIHSLAVKSALPPSSIKNILYGDSLNPRVVIIKMICDALDMTLAEFFDTDYFNNLEPEVK